MAARRRLDGPLFRPAAPPEDGGGARYSTGVSSHDAMLGLRGALRALHAVEPRAPHRAGRPAGAAAAATGKATGAARARLRRDDRDDDGEGEDEDEEDREQGEDGEGKYQDSYAEYEDDEEDGTEEAADEEAEEEAEDGRGSAALARGETAFERFRAARAEAAFGPASDAAWRARSAILEFESAVALSYRDFEAQLGAADALGCVPEGSNLEQRVKLAAGFLGLSEIDPEVFEAVALPNFLEVAHEAVAAIGEEGLRRQFGRALAALNVELRLNACLRRYFQHPGPRRGDGDPAALRAAARRLFPESWTPKYASSACERRVESIRAAVRVVGDGSAEALDEVTQDHNVLELLALAKTFVQALQDALLGQPELVGVAGDIAVATASAAKRTAAVRASPLKARASPLKAGFVNGGGVGTPQRKAGVHPAEVDKLHPSPARVRREAEEVEVEMEVERASEARARSPVRESGTPRARAENGAGTRGAEGVHGVQREAPGAKRSSPPSSPESVPSTAGPVALGGGGGAPAGDGAPADDGGGAAGGKKRSKWSAQEEEALREGVRKFGDGSWARIRSEYVDVFNSVRPRSNVDLKDKWRNMSKSFKQG